MMEIVVYSVDQLDEQQRQRESAFYAFLYDHLLTPLPPNPAGSTASQGLNRIYYAGFLKTEFNAFPVGRGYPIISRFCAHQQCYFFVQAGQAKDLDHNFFRFINREIPNLKCKCGAVIRNPADFVYDSALAGLLQLKLTPQEVGSLQSVEITKHHEVFVPKRGVFQEAFNRARLKALMALGNDLKGIKAAEDNAQVESRTMRVDTYDIMHGLEQQLAASDLFAGRGRGE
jgi:hypothetical protein